MFTFTIDSSNYDETKLNLVQIEELINKHRNLIGRIKKNQRYYEANHDIKRRHQQITELFVITLKISVIQQLVIL